MPTNTTRKIAVITSAAVLFGGAGLGAAQAATSSDTSTHPAKQQRGGPGGPNLDAVAAKLGVTTAQLKAAMDATRPAKPAKGAADGFATDLAAALNADAAKVKEILDANRPAKPATRPAPGTKPAKPDDSKLVTALATGLGLDEATVKAALAKLRPARGGDHADHAAMDAAIAKELGLTADAVQAAFAAGRPAKPAASS